MKKLIILALAVAIVAAGLYLVLGKGEATTPTGEQAAETFPNQEAPLSFPSQSATGSAATPTGGGTQTNANISEVTGGISASATNTIFLNQAKSIERISEARVASGEIAVGTVKGLDLHVRYIEAGTGHIYDYRPVGKARERVSNVTIPRVAEAYWGNKGQSALVRYFDETGGMVKNYLVRFSTTAATSSDKLLGTFISDTITDAAVAPVGEEETSKTGQVAGSKLAYVIADGTRVKILLSDFDNKSITTKFTSILSEWRLLWPAKDSLVLVTSPSSIAAGYAYQLVGNTLKPLVWDIRGLTVLVSPKLDKIIYSQSALGGLRALIKNVKEGGVRDFPLITLPQDKCVWSRTNSNIVYCAAPTQTLGGGYPDLWYQGRVSFSDNIYSVNLDTDTVTLLYSASSQDTATEAPDVTNLIVAEDDSHLFFKNKKDGYLYQIPITGLSTGE